MNPFLKRFLQGMFLGLAFITGIGGGTMAILIGIYDDLVDSVANFRKNSKASFSYLFPLLLGAFLAVGAMFYPIKLLLDHFPFITVSFFAGVTLGGMRLFMKTIKGHYSKQNTLLAIAGFFFVFAIGLFSYFSTLSADLLNITWLQIFLLLLVSIIAMSGLVAPGISGTFILISFGYYSEIIDFVTRLVKFEFVSPLMDFAGFLSLAIGALIGLTLVSNIFSYCLKKTRIKTYWAILGFVVGSVVTAYFNGNIKSHYGPLMNSGTSSIILTVVLSIIFFVVGIFITYIIMGIVDKKEQSKIKFEEEHPHVGV